MLFLGHIGFTSFILSMFYLPALGGIIGTLLPDIVDKGLFILGYAPCSRFLAHTLFFPPVLGLMSYGITRNKKLAFAVTLGAFLHLLEDTHDNVPFLYPVKMYSFLDNCGGIQIRFTPYFIITDTIGGALTIFVFGFRKRFVALRESSWRIVYKVSSWKKN